jgi:hypothetical protein
MKLGDKGEKKGEIWEDYGREMEAQASIKKPGLWPESHTVKPSYFVSRILNYKKGFFFD